MSFELVKLGVVVFEPRPYAQRARHCWHSVRAQGQSQLYWWWCTGVHCYRWHSCCTCNCYVTTGWCFDVEFGQCLGRITHSIRRALTSAEVCDSVDIEYTCWGGRPGFAYSVLWPGSGFASIRERQSFRNKANPNLVLWWQLFPVLWCRSYRAFLFSNHRHIILIVLTTKSVFVLEVVWWVTRKYSESRGVLEAFLSEAR